MFGLIRACIQNAIAWILAVVFSGLIMLQLVYTYITRITSTPWQPKNRVLMETPTCLNDPKYGVHKYLTINKYRLHYVEAGDKSKPLMIFVHGFPEFWYSWRHQITEFSKDYWTIALDMRGYGLSDKPTGVANYKMEHMVEDLRMLIEHLNRKQCILVCHDWGAVIGWAFVEKYNHMVHKYVMMGAPSPSVFTKLLHSTMEQFCKSWYMFFFKMPCLPECLLSTSDFAVFSAMKSNGHFTEYFTEDDLETYKFAFSKPGALTAPINYYRANIPPTGGKITGKSKNNGEKGLFVLGEKDAYISQKSIEVTQQLYPLGRVEVVPGANHFVQQDAPKETNHLIRSFIGFSSQYKVEPFYA